jgi:hypothetical protein
MAWSQVANIKGPKGDQGNPGDTGPQGSPGTPGTRGATWFTGNGAPPPSIPGSLPEDLYINLDTGDVYKLA